MSRPNRNRGSPRGAGPTAHAARVELFWGQSATRVPRFRLAMSCSMANPVARRRRTACGDRRAFAYGLFTGTSRTAWALGSIVIGVLVSVLPRGLVAFSVARQMASIPDPDRRQAYGMSWYPRGVTQ